MFVHATDRRLAALLTACLVQVQRGIYSAKRENRPLLSALGLVKLLAQPADFLPHRPDLVCVKQDQLLVLFLDLLL